MSTWRVRRARPPSPIPSILLRVGVMLLVGFLLLGCAPKQGPLFTLPVPPVEVWGEPVPFEREPDDCAVEEVKAGQVVEQAPGGVAVCGGVLGPDVLLYDLDEETKRADHYARAADDQHHGRVLDRELVAEPALERERAYSKQLDAQLRVGRWTVVGLTLAIPVAAALAYWAGFKTGSAVFGAGGVALRVEWAP